MCIAEALNIAIPASFNLSIRNEVKDIAVIADYNKTVEAILNVITNKIRYAKTTILLIARKHGTNTYLYISDDGEGISKDKRAKLFERFYHSNDTTGGSVGLGLSISKAIMMGQEGKLYIEDENTFVFVFRRF